MRASRWMVAGLSAGLAAGLVVSMAVSPVAAAGDLAAVGSAAPNFTLPSQDASPVSLSSFKGKWVVLYFYPKDQTAGCSKEAHNFQRDLPKYEALNAVVLGVSMDTVDSHKTWCTKDGFSFKMLADPEHKVVDAYGVPVKTFGTTSIAMRDTFLISPEGKIVKEWEVKDIDNHSAEVLAAIEAAKG
jgi:thioredoxin-dependent peroxiredoxin